MKDIIFSIIADLPTKEVGDNKLYFDRESKEVVAIEQRDKLSYVVMTKSNEAKVMSELLDGLKGSCIVNLQDFFVIPEIEQRKDSEFLSHRELPEPCQLFCSCIFEVINYGVLTMENFKGAILDKAKIDVAVLNGHGSIYQVSMIVADGVRGCDGNPHGSIPNAYKIKPIGYFDDHDGVFIAATL